MHASGGRCQYAHPIAVRAILLPMGVILLRQLTGILVGLEDVMSGQLQMVATHFFIKTL
jgi:hypothetical protein